MMKIRGTRDKIPHIVNRGYTYTMEEECSMNDRPVNPYALSQWEYYQMQKVMEKKGFVKKKSCGCSNKKKNVQDDQQNQQGQ